jgi:hypothetical protein
LATLTAYGNGASLRKARKEKKRAKRSPNGTRKERQKQPAPKLLIRFGNALPVTNPGYMDRANTMAGALMPAELSKAISAALNSAR